MSQDTESLPTIPKITISWMWTKSSHILAQQRLTASPSRCGTTTNWPWTLRWLSTEPVSSASSYMAVSHGLCTQGRHGGSTPFTQCNLRRILDIKWSNRVTNNEVLKCTAIPSIITLPWQRRLCWLGHIIIMPVYRHCLNSVSRSY